MYEIYSKISILIIVLIKLCSSENTVEVTINQGSVLGKIEKTFFGKREYYAFRGIPYAAPPLNELRFKPPVPHKGWEGTLEALETKPTCMQFSSRMRNDEPFGLSGTEDCLHLSIFTPNIKGKAPVIVFDYNDNFRTGFNGTDIYSPENFIDEDVLTVTINHRLGLLGYLTTEDEVIPGNNGLRDFILGLQWVKDNIESFGGDPEKVTLMGSLGGAALVNIFLYSEQAKGLFNNAILQSGSAFETTYFPTNSRAYAFYFGEALNISLTDSASLLEGLQKLDIETLYKGEINVIAKHTEETKNTQYPVQMFTPIVERGYSDAVISNLPEESAVINDVPVLIGFNTREGLDFISHFLKQPTLLPTNADENLLQFPIRTNYKFERESKIFKEANIEIRDFYFEIKNLDYSNIPEYAVYAGDFMNGYSLNYAVKSLSSNLQSPVYYYNFDFMGQLNENSLFIMKKSRYPLGTKGATVGDELCYLHICKRIEKKYELLSKAVSEQREFKILKKMTRMWTNFAKYGNPTPPQDDVLNGFTWEPVRKDEELNYLHISKNLKMAKNPLGEREKFWDEFLEKYSKLAVDGVVRIEERDEL